MLVKTKGIVLNYFKYGETSIIAKIYTRDFGLQTYIINGVRSNNKKNLQKISFFQPLTLLDLVVYRQKEGTKMSRIKELKCYHPFQQIPLNFKKINMAFFVAEVLHKTLREEENAQPDLFNFLESACVFLDSTEQGFDYFHIHFLLKTTYFLGFAPSTAGEILGQVRQYKKVWLMPEQEQGLLYYLDFFLFQEFTKTTAIHADFRKLLIDTILDYYHLHIASFYPIKSLEVLREMNN